MDTSNINPQMMQMQIQNMKLQLNNLQFQIDKLYMVPMELSMSGINIINTGIQILMKCLEIGQMGVNPQIISNINNIGFQLNNIGMSLQKYGPNQTNQMNGMNSNIQPSINQGMMNTQNMNIINNFIPMKLINFKDMEGNSLSLNVPCNTPLNQLIENYYQKKPDLKKENIEFLYNGKRINQNDTQTISSFFGNCSLYLLSKIPMIIDFVIYLIRKFYSKLLN